MTTNSPRLDMPTYSQIGRDLLTVPRWRVALSLASPFVLAVAYATAATANAWIFAVGCVVALSFVTYGSISHDLVHRSLQLPNRLNDLLLSAIELLLLRSGRAYRLAHLNHHSRFPHDDDPEAAAAGRSLGVAILHGPWFFIRVWYWAFRTSPTDRTRLLLEAGLSSALVSVAILVAALGWSLAPLVYVLLAYCGTWIVPVVTAYIPHDPHGVNPLTQTRRFRGGFMRLLALDHLYHLEHHLYPAVPHHRWPELARRLDPYFDRAGIRAIRCGI